MATLSGAGKDSPGDSEEEEDADKRTKVMMTRAMMLKSNHPQSTSIQIIPHHDKSHHPSKN